MAGDGLPERRQNALRHRAERHLDRAFGVDAEDVGELAQAARQRSLGVGARHGEQRSAGGDQREAFLRGQPQRPVEPVGVADPHPAVLDRDLHQRVGRERVDAAAPHEIELGDELRLGEPEPGADVVDARTVRGDDPRHEGQEAPESIVG